MRSSSQRQAVTERNQFGTFGGVFTPSILTIFGLIMFMRANQVTGTAGVLPSLFILTVSSGITFLTGLSISGISSNTPVKGGGAYFLISRVLGPVFGTAIGLALYLAQAISVPFYILGFVEAVVQTFPALSGLFFWLCLGVLGVLFALVWSGAGWVIKIQYGILAVLLAAIAAFMIGAFTRFDPAIFRANLHPQYGEGENLWKMFALYFPAVTGIMAGVNMSGDLKNPARSIPLGTLLAVACGYAVYGLQILLCGGMAPRAELVSRPFLLLVDNAVFGFGWLVVAGVFLATISSAIGSDLGAPRVLQAVARDRALPFLGPFAKGSSKGDEPRRALVFTFLIGLGTLILFGQGGSGRGLNVVAGVVTMVFLYTYGMTNLAAFVEHFSLNPSFRPRFRFFHWWTALAGCAACVWVAFMINVLAAVLALVFIAGIFVIVSQRELSQAFGDARRGFIYASLGRNLERLANMPLHAKNWRPTILVLSGNPPLRGSLVACARWLGQRSGIISVMNVVEEKRREHVRARDLAARKLTEFCTNEAPGIFPEVVMVEDFDRDLNVILQSYSIGPIKPNMVVIGWPRDRARLAPYFDHLRTIIDLKMSLVIYASREVGPPRARQRIDIWWRGQRNGSLMVILGHLVSLNSEWRGVRLRLLRHVENDSEVKEVRQELAAILAEGRIEADIAVPVSAAPFIDVFRTHSMSAAMTVLGLNRVAESVQEGFFDAMEALLEGMPPSLLICSSGEADLMA